MSDEQQCEGRLNFLRAPYLNIRCHRKPGHEGLCEAMTSALTGPSEWEGIRETTSRARVWLSWKK